MSVSWRLREYHFPGNVRELENVRYNKTKAAQLLGMTFRSLRYRIKKLGIE